MQKQTTSQNPHLKLDLHIDLTAFCENIKSNFILIWETLNKQAQQITLIKQRSSISNIVPKGQNLQQRVESSSSNRKVSQNISLNYSQSSFVFKKDDQKQKVFEQSHNPQIGVVAIEQTPVKAASVKNVQQNGTEKPSQPKPKTNASSNKKLNQNNQFSKVSSKKTIQIQPSATNLKQDRQILLQNSSLNTPSPSKQYIINNNNSKNQDVLQMIESKISQMNDRLEHLQLAAVKQNSNFSKKMNQIYNQVGRSTDELSKKQGQFKKLQFIIQKLRGQLSQFKLKKQAQIMKLSINSNGANNVSAKNQFLEILLQKVQQINNSLPYLMLKTDFQDFKLELQPQLNKMQRKITQKVTQQQFEGLVNLLSKKKTTTGVFPTEGVIAKKLNHTSKNKNQPNQQGQINQEQQQQFDPIIQLKLIPIQKSIKQIQQYLDNDKQQKQRKQNKVSQKLKQHSQKIQNIQNSINRSQVKSVQHETFMKNMNQSYNQKFKQVINQIAESQQEIDKIINQIKFINYVKPQHNANNSQNGQGGVPVGDPNKIIDLQNQLNTLKKKVNKTTLKIQSIKQQMLGVRQDFAKDVDVIKATLQKKCDWQSLKKSMHHFQQRIKQVSNYLVYLQQSINQPADNNQSTAAKRGWTCLCCDKDIKQYQGKLGQIKFTSIFPSRYQSPRIGGYYKQRQGQKQYKQVFMKHNRRNSNQKSKDQLNI